MYTDLILLFVVGFAGGGISTFLVRAFALKNKIVNQPNPIVPQHTKPIAYLGGIGIALGFGIVIGYLYFSGKFPANDLPLTALIFGSISFLLLGICDDLKAFSALKKFAAQLLLSCICVAMGLQTTLFDIPFFDIIISVFWILFVVNAVNITDVCDGLVGGIAAVTFFILGLLMHNNLILSLSAAIAGFLVFNLPRASIFLGDAGSHFLGFLLAASAIHYGRELNTADALVWMLLVPAVPVFEMIFVTLVRIRKGKAWWKGSPDHFSLRLQQAKLSRWQTGLLSWTVGALLIWFACMLTEINEMLKYGLLACVLLFFVWCGKMLLRWEIEK